jgi:MipA family protein
MRPGRLSPERAIRVFLPLAVLTASMQAAAEESEANSFSDKWNVVLGAGAINLPRYPGSRDDYTRGLPAVSINYDRYFIGGAPGGGGPAGLGAYLVRTEHWAVGLTVGGDARKPRRASDDPILHGWGDIPATVRGGMFATYSIEWLSIRGSVSEAGHHEGVIASLGAEAQLHPTPRLTLSVGPKVTWTDEQYAMTFFGIDAAQSEIAGVPPYRARAGLNMVSAEAGARYALTRNWSVAANVSYGRLQGDAANSPVTTDKTQRVISAFVLYRFPRKTP